MPTTAQLGMQKTLALFDAPDQDAADVEWFLGFLKGRDWTTAEECLAAIGRQPTEDEKRWIRKLSEKSKGVVLGFSKGYRLTKSLTPEEYQHWRNTSLKALNSVKEKVLMTDQVFGWKGKDE
jgi:hypothetical protein